MDAILPFLVVVLVVLSVAVWIRLAILPIQVAKQRNHPQYDAIFVTSLIALVVPPLWILAIIWAYTAPQPPAKPASDSQAKIAAARAKWEEEQAARRAEG